MKTGEYRIYKLYRADINEVITEFFLPDDYDLEKLTKRLAILAAYKLKGYSIIGMVKCDKESYLNARLDERVKDYCIADAQEQKAKRDLAKGLINASVFFDTMACIQSNKTVALKCIAMNIRRLMREDFDVYNEIGIQLYDQLPDELK